MVVNDLEAFSRGFGSLVLISILASLGGHVLRTYSDGYDTWFWNKFGTCCHLRLEIVNNASTTYIHNEQYCLPLQNKNHTAIMLMYILRRHSRPHVTSNPPRRLHKPHWASRRGVGSDWRSSDRWVQRRGVGRRARAAKGGIHEAITECAPLAMGQRRCEVGPRSS